MFKTKEISGTLAQKSMGNILKEIKPFDKCTLLALFHVSCVSLIAKLNQTVIAHQIYFHGNAFY